MPRDWSANGIRASIAAHHPQSRGFDDYFGFLVGGHNFILHKDAEAKFGSAHSHDMIYRSREVQKLDGYTTDLFTDEALAFMDRHADKPWFLYLAYNAVHTPLEILEKYGDRVPASITDPAAARLSLAARRAGRRDRPGHARYLRKTGQDKDTLIFFFSDNGGSGRKPFLAYNTGVNTPLRGDKGQTLEGGIRVPFFVVVARQAAGGQDLRSARDRAGHSAHRLAAAGAKPRADFDGVNLIPHLTGRRHDRAARVTLLAVRSAEGDSQGQMETGGLARFRDEAEQRLAAIRSRERHRRKEQPGGIAAAARRRAQRRMGPLEQAQHCPALARQHTEDPTAPAPAKANKK